ncbi:hypothetical protein EVG20_g8777 [Dentipellis fragilis]|uniref:Uncharacterized protein n=1 Tax=Dentipellis fragilis TaxID=205917 RepID=A0A4Y9Y359_9AGAM|nr:hypothetical protein EVG20_g8777 [Dentipellis fragilis]
MLLELPDPSHSQLRQYDAARVQKHYEQQAQYFTILRLGSVGDPVNSSFVHRDGFKALVYCEENLTTIQYSIRVDFSAIVFEVDARIDPTHCYLTPNGDHDHPYSSEVTPSDKFASSWFRAPSDAHEDVLAWCRALNQLERIVQQAVDPGAALGELVAPDYSQGSESPLAFLQVGWRPPIPYTLEWLPVFTTDHKHYPIPSLAAVPFGKRVRVRFVLHGVPAKPNVPAIIGAHMLYMHILD